MQDKIEKFFRILNETKEPAYDVETTGLDWKRNKCVGYSISDGKEAVYIPTNHTGGNNIGDPVEFESRLANVLNNNFSGTIVGHNIKFDMHFSENQGIKFNRVADTMVREALIDENQRSYSLENVCNRRPGIVAKKGKGLYQHIAEKTGCKNDRSAMGNFHLLRGDDPIAVEYAEGDTLSTKQLFDAQTKQLYAEQLDVVSDLENKLTKVLQKMERRGVLTDPEAVAKVKEEVQHMGYLCDLELGKFDFTTGEFTVINPRSGHDLKEYFEACEIDDWPITEPTQRFPDGQASFPRDFLMGSEQGMVILNARRIAHLQSSFLDPLDNFLFRNRVHTTFNQTRGETHGTRSGRLSCSWPNMQQVPRRDEELGKIYRRMFVSRPDYILVEYDYSQAEPRLFTHYSGEPLLLEGYNKTPCVDMHAIAAEYMGLNKQHGEKKGRAIAKNLNLGVMYTMGPGKLSRKLGTSYDEALEILKKWQRTFPRVSSYSRTDPGFTQIAQRAAEHRGYVKTILGRRSRFDNPKFAYRAANRIVQGGSADILKWKLVEIDRYLEESNLEDVCEMLLTIHDSILFQIHKDFLPLIHVLKDILERVQVPPFNLTVPFIADYKTGVNWSKATYGQ